MSKLIFWHRGYDWRKDPTDLKLTAKRLDREAAVIKVEHANAVFVGSVRPAMMTGLYISTQGFWSITAERQGQRLTFVVSVEP